MKPSLLRRAVIGAVLLLATTTAASAEQVVPEPPLVVDGGVEDGRVTLEPATQAVGGGRVEWLLSNGGDAALRFAVAIHDVITSGDGDVEVAGPRSDLDLGLDEIRLGPGEVARIPLWLPAEVTATTLALVARTIDAEPQTQVSGLVLVSGDGEVTPEVVTSDASAGVFTVRLASDGPAIVDLAVRASAWPGLARTDEVLEDVLVPAGGRDLDVALSGPVVGRLTVEVVAVGLAEARTSATLWWWPRPFLIGIAAVLVLVALALVLRVRRRHGASLV